MATHTPHIHTTREDVLETNEVQLAPLTDMWSPPPSFPTFTAGPLSISAEKKNKKNEKAARGRLRSLGPSLVLAINPCITFYVFDELKTWFLRRKISRMKGAEAAEVNVTDSYQKLTPLETLCLGAMAKAVASTITFPLLMAKIRMGLFGKERYPTMMSTFSTVLQEEGFAGMFKGMGLSLMRSVFIAALEFAMRDKVQESIQKALTQKAVKGSR
eukprot:TRINITY_DN20055_c1_g2_i1.p1 TRINITY_DN20055_c1_g2~~TRINITY_DN20055_c1_g2_i1.p1  ORF type:complete len:215 (+),score=40.42 TRINITY_DN20055_c1_g2_i1:152-796(+)